MNHQITQRPFNLTFFPTLRKLILLSIITISSHMFHTNNTTSFIQY